MPINYVNTYHFTIIKEIFPRQPQLMYWFHLLVWSINCCFRSHLWLCCKPQKYVILSHTLTKQIWHHSIFLTRLGLLCVAVPSECLPSPSPSVCPAELLSVRRAEPWTPWVAPRCSALLHQTSLCPISHLLKETEGWYIIYPQVSLPGYAAQLCLTAAVYDTASG